MKTFYSDYTYEYVARCPEPCGGVGTIGFYYTGRAVCGNCGEECQVAQEIGRWLTTKRWFSKQRVWEKKS